MGWLGANTPRIQQAYREAGYVIVCDAPVMVNIPFEYLCGGRSMQKFFLDLYRMPDQGQGRHGCHPGRDAGSIKAAPPFGGIRGTWLGGWRVSQRAGGAQAVGQVRVAVLSSSRSRRWSRSASPPCCTGIRTGHATWCGCRNCRPRSAS